MQEIRIIAHCLINPSVRLKGLKPPNQPDITGCVIQLPCPEAAYFGLKRWEITKEQLDMPNYRRFCRNIFRTTSDIIRMLNQEGHIIKLIGVPGSPSCGIRTICTGFDGGRLKEVSHIHTQGTGVFFDEIIRELEEKAVTFSIDE
jgi:predicted secreted protein